MYVSVECVTVSFDTRDSFNVNIAAASLRSASWPEDLSTVISRDGGLRIGFGGATVTLTWPPGAVCRRGLGSGALVGTSSVDLVGEVSTSVAGSSIQVPIPPGIVNHIAQPVC